MKIQTKIRARANHQILSQKAHLFFGQKKGPRINPAAPVPHAHQAPTSTAVPALPHSILPMSKRKATLMDQQLTDLSQLLGATEAKKRMADIIVDRMAASYSAHCDSNEAYVYR